MKTTPRSLCCKLASLACNLAIVGMEIIASPISWDGVGAQMFTFYTEDSNLFAMVVCALVAACQLRCIVTGRELPLWAKRLKFIAASCLLLTFLTVVFILAPMYGPDGHYVMLLTSSMLYNHFLNPVVAALSFILFEREPRLPRSTVRWALLPTVIYGGIVLLLNIARVMEGPYPFMLVYQQTVQESIEWFAVILGTNYFYAWLLWRAGGNAAGKQRSRRRRAR